MNDNAPAGKAKAAYIFNLQADMGQNVQFGISGNLMEGQSPADMNRVLDEVFSLVKRQKLKVFLPVIEARIAERKQALVDAKVGLERIGTQLRDHQERLRNGDTKARERQIEAAIEKIKAGADAQEDVCNRIQAEIEEAEARLKSTTEEIDAIANGE